MESHFLLPLSKFEELTTRMEELKEAVKNPPAHLNDWISEKEAQQLLGLGATSLWSLRRARQIRFSKIGSRIFYSKKSIERLLDKNER